jgi:hypothetical protein
VRAELAHSLLSLESQGLTTAKTGNISQRNYFRLFLLFGLGADNAARQLRLTYGEYGIVLDEGDLATIDYYVLGAVQDLVLGRCERCQTQLFISQTLDKQLVEMIFVVIFKELFELGFVGRVYHATCQGY